jgi:hypothetical protein
VIARRQGGRSRVGAAAVVLATALPACRTGPQPTAHLETLFSDEGARAARARAPDLYARAQRARREAEAAERAGDPQAASDHATRARLLLSAAEAEAERIAAENERLEAEQTEQAALSQARRNERTRAEIEAAVERELAARVAREQADKAFEVADEDERRGRRGRRSKAEYRAAAQFLTERTRLVLSAARALGAPGDAIARVEDMVRRARRVDDPTERIAAADRALMEARAVLGQARAAGQRPSEDEVASLLAAAHELGMDASRIDHGLALEADVFAGARGTRLQAARVRRLAALLRAHPHGPIRIEVAHDRARGAERRARRRADALAKALEQEKVEADRLQPVAAEADGFRVRIVLPAY